MLLIHLFLNCFELNFDIDILNTLFLYDNFQYVLLFHHNFLWHLDSDCANFDILSKQIR